MSGVCPAWTCFVSNAQLVGSSGVLMHGPPSVYSGGPSHTDPRLPVTTRWWLLNLVNHPGHPTAVGGLPASKPGLDAGTHDREVAYRTRLAGCQPLAFARHAVDCDRVAPPPRGYGEF